MILKLFDEILVTLLVDVAVPSAMQTHLNSTTDPIFTASQAASAVANVTATGLIAYKAWYCTAHFDASCSLNPSSQESSSSVASSLRPVGPFYTNGEGSPSAGRIWLYLSGHICEIHYAHLYRVSTNNL